ncbi:fumarylpyruvate hydrolase [Frondihabitans sp. PhB188]|uniref:fumarylacetoacetate hydrolase family protein n=1 Tax=Frondihabitans sp. PhB188 TaxID=2485200 RepID=UPI000F49CC81|nr:fumarylacetoacetate hydrolase family protein [Frondihabitans sp. PhB188]ROQ39582.1 fumarylpyruvate hydrolase [Frondihabitans sp. PhB188]
MAGFAFAPPPVPSVAISGSDERFPVRRILCVGRNYAEHAREMGSDPDREPPFFFAKPGDAVVPASGTVPYPTLTSRLEFEVELVVAIGVGGSSISPADALEHVWGYAVGVDLTRRDRQQEAKDTRRPWDVAKGFDASAPLTPLVPRASLMPRVSLDAGGLTADALTADALDAASGRIWLAVDGVVAQDGDLADQIWPVADVIAAASRAWELAPGDLIFTGTPSGVGPVAPGQTLSGGIQEIGTFEFVLGAAPGV